MQAQLTPIAISEQSKILASDIYKTLKVDIGLSVNVNEEDLYQFWYRYNQLADSDEFKVNTIEEATNLCVMVAILELEFESDSAVMFAIDKIVNYDATRMMASQFVAMVKAEIPDDKVIPLLKSLGFTITVTKEDAYELIALTSYFRSSTKFKMETDKKYIDAMTVNLPYTHVKFIKALYITNSYAVGLQASIHNFITELWEDSLSDEKLLKRPSAYETKIVTDEEKGLDVEQDYFEISDEQINASAELPADSEKDINNA